MRKMTLIFAASISGVLVACAAAPKNSNTPAQVTKTAKVLELEHKLREKEEALQDMKDRNRVLNKKAAISAPMLAAKANPQNKKIEIIGGATQTAKNDRELYAEMVGSYDRNNEIAFFSRLQAFMEKYPKSPLADDALYLAGLMSLSNKNYGPALRYMNQVLKKYPSSNKASAALFAKGVALKKMNLTDEARMAFTKVRNSYPGSPESMRAETELKLLVR